MITHISGRQLQALHANNSQKSGTGRYAVLNVRNRLALDKYSLIALQN